MLLRLPGISSVCAYVETSDHFREDPNKRNWENSRIRTARFSQHVLLRRGWKSEKTRCLFWKREVGIKNAESILRHRDLTTTYLVFYWILQSFNRPFFILSSLSVFCVLFCRRLITWAMTRAASFDVQWRVYLSLCFVDANAECSHLPVAGWLCAVRPVVAATRIVVLNIIFTHELFPLSSSHCGFPFSPCV